MRLWRTLVDAFFWRLNEDQEWEHRLWKEHNGEPDYSTIWSRYIDETDNAELTRSVTWTHWGLGFDVEQGWDSIWQPTRQRGPGRVQCRRWFAGVHFGPFSLIYARIAPRRIAAVEEQL